MTRGDYLYKYEMHAHCMECSACAVSTAVEMVRAFKDVGYAGMVFTDHFIHGNTAIPRNLSWEKRMEMMFIPYNKAIQLGKEFDFDVLIGLEHAYGDGKEVLIYGEITEEILSTHPEINKMNVIEFAEFAHKQGWFVAQAHPFRERDYINMSVEPIPSILDGVEVYNYGNKPEENILAVSYAEKHKLIPISGSDTHSVNLIGLSGMAFPKRVTTASELIKQIRLNFGRLIVDGEIV